MDGMDIGVVKGTKLVFIQFENPALKGITTPEICMKFEAEGARALARLLLKKADEAEFPTALPPGTD